MHTYEHFNPETPVTQNIPNITARNVPHRMAIRMSHRVSLGLGKSFPPHQRGKVPKTLAGLGLAFEAGG